MKPAKMDRLLKDQRAKLAARVEETREYEKDDIPGAMSHVNALIRLIGFDMTAPYLRFSNRVNAKINRG